MGMRPSGTCRLYGLAASIAGSLRCTLVDSLGLLVNICHTYSLNKAYSSNRGENDWLWHRELCIALPFVSILQENKLVPDMSRLVSTLLACDGCILEPFL